MKIDLKKSNSWPSNKKNKACSSSQLDCQYWIICEGNSFQQNRILIWFCHVKRFYWKFKLRRAWFVMFEEAVVQTCIIAVQEMFILLKYVQQNSELWSPRSSNSKRSCMSRMKWWIELIFNVLIVEGSDFYLDHWCYSAALTLTRSWQRSLSNRSQSVDLLCKSMDWFLYDIDLCHEEIKILAVHCWCT